MIAARGGASLEADAAIVAEHGAYYSRRGVGLSYMGEDGAVLYSSIPTNILPDGENQGLLELKETGAVPGISASLLPWAAALWDISGRQKAYSSGNGSRICCYSARLRYSLWRCRFFSISRLSGYTGL